MTGQPALTVERGHQRLHAISSHGCRSYSYSVWTYGLNADTGPSYEKDQIGIS